MRNGLAQMQLAISRVYRCLQATERDFCCVRHVDWEIEYCVGRLEEAVSMREVLRPYQAVKQAAGISEGSKIKKQIGKVGSGIVEDQQGE